MATQASFKLHGASELRARMRAIKGVFKPTAKKWADDTVKNARATVHSPRGNMRRSIRRRNASKTRATVYADYRVIFIDRGTKVHQIKLKRDSGSRRGGAGTARVLTSGYMKPSSSADTVFGRKVWVRGQQARPFIERSARMALADNPMAEELIALWNQGGGRGRVNIL